MSLLEKDINGDLTATHRDTERGYPLCDGSEGPDEMFCTNGVDGVLGTHELGTRVRYIEAFEKRRGKSTEGDSVTGEKRNVLPSTPVFPPEIFDLIISHLSDYPLILRQVILVSKSWAPLCRRHIYSALNFCCGDNFERTCPYPNLVRRISLVSQYGHSSVRWLDPLIQNIQHFSSLDHLEMVGIQWDALWRDDGMGLLNAPVMQQVTTIFLGNVEVEYLDDVATFIGYAFPRLHQLAISMEVFWDGDEYQVDVSDIHEVEVAPLQVSICPPSPPPAWSKFVVQDHPMYPTPTGFWWRWFAVTKFTGLRSIILGGIPQEDYPLMEAYLAFAGHPLLQLEVAFACLQDLDLFVSHRILRSCQNLESLRISQSGRVIHETWSKVESIKVFRHMFSSFAAPHLYTIALPVTEDCGAVDTGIRVEAALTRERFPSLKSVEFVNDC